MEKKTKTSLEIFKAKASAALKRKKSHITYTMSFPSFAQDTNGDEETGEPLEIKFRTLSDAEINDCVGYESDDPNGADKYAMYIAAVEPSLKELGAAMKEAGEVMVPMEIMDMFERHEITEAAMIIMEKSGVLSKNKVTVVDKGIENLKN